MNFMKQEHKNKDIYKLIKKFKKKKMLQLNAHFNQN